MLTNILYQYLYEEYNDDETLQAFVDAYNNYGQQYLNTFIQTVLPVYISPTITGSLLDWVAEGLYGMVRPVLPVPGSISTGVPYNAAAFNSIPYNESGEFSGGTFFSVSDDYFKRMITWNFYKGDGFQYNTRWLKRRVFRFLYGGNGIDPLVQETYNISVTYPSANAITITVPDIAAGTILALAVESQVLNLPVIYEYTVTT